MADRVVKRDKVVKTFFTIFIVAMVLLVLTVIGVAMGANLFGEVRETHEEYDVIYVDAPFGRFYSGTEGHMTWPTGEQWVTTGEAYTVKYLEGNEIKTKILSSEDDSTHVVLGAENISFERVTKTMYGRFTGVQGCSKFDYYIRLNITAEDLVLD